METRPPLLCTASARAFDQNLAHRSRGDADEMALVGPGRAGVRQPHIRLVDERGGLQRLTRTFPPHVGRRKASQLVVNERGEGVSVLRAAGHFAILTARWLSSSPVTSHRREPP